MAVSRINEAGLNVNQYGNRNLIINGAMQVAQRGTTFSLTGNGYGQYTLDRWAAYYNYTEVAQLNAVIDGQYKNYVKISGNVSNNPTNLFFYQKIESGSKLLSGKTFTLSFLAKSSNNTAVRIRGRFYDSAAETNSVASTISSSISLTSDWTKYTVTHTATDSSANMTRDFFLLFDNVGGSFSSGDDFWLTEIQLEVGDTATDFEHRTFGDELARCQRYYFNSDEADSFIQAFDVTSGNAYYFTIMNPTTMRTGPTITLSNESNSNFDGITVFRNYATRWSGYDTATGSGRGYWQFEYEADAEL